MSLFTDADLAAIKTAIITAATSGIAEVTLSGQSVRSYSLKELRELLDLIQGDLAAGNTDGLGLRFRKFVPNYT